MPARKPSERRTPETAHLGGFGERLAAAHLEAKGYRIVGRNVRAPDAELDLIVRDGDVVVFVEVRTRRGAYPGMAALSVTRGKARKLLRAVERYVEAHPEVGDAPLRIDVVAVEVARDGTLHGIEHYEDAIRPG